MNIVRYVLPIKKKKSSLFVIYSLDIAKVIIVGTGLRAKLKRRRGMNVEHSPKLLAREEKATIKS